MAMSNLSRMLIVVFWLCVTPGISSRLLAEQPIVEWLRSAGEDLELRLSGQVLEPDGSPATSFSITGYLQVSESEVPVHPVITGSRFEVWLPVNRARWQWVTLRAASFKGGQIGFCSLKPYEVRQAAREGLSVHLKPADRIVEVLVTDGGKPVPDATVTAQVAVQSKIVATTDQSGIARVKLTPTQILERLTAWTEDQRIGGYIFSRKPARDPTANRFEVELSKCRDLRLAFIDEAGTPVPKLDFEVHVATPEYNYIGTDQLPDLSTNADGEAIFRWLPDWKRSEFYVELATTDWIIEGEKEVADEQVLIHVKKPTPRKQIAGKIVSDVTDVGGFYVAMRSFQAERKSHSDILSTFADAAGNFAIDVLPDSTYSAYALDSQWVGETFDLKPYDSATDHSEALELTVLRGQKVKIITTSGAERRPMPNLYVHFYKRHNYSWQENGKTRYGNGGPMWSAKTDDQGQIVTQSLPGELRVSASTPLWRANELVTVAENAPTTVRLHRVLQEQRTITGKLVKTSAAKADISGAILNVAPIGSNDNEYDRQLVTSDEQGGFSFEVRGTKIGVLIATTDGLAAAVKTFNIDAKLPLEIDLQPTATFYGFLLDKAGQPHANQQVLARLRIDGEEDSTFGVSKTFIAKEFCATTDESGGYTLTGLPTGIDIRVYSLVDDDQGNLNFLETINLQPDD